MQLTFGLEKKIDIPPNTEFQITIKTYVFYLVYVIIVKHKKTLFVCKQIGHRTRWIINIDSILLR